MKKEWIVAFATACALLVCFGCKNLEEDEPAPTPIVVESVTIDKTTLTLTPGETIKLKATIKPENADDKTVKWSSSDTSVAMVGSDGTVGAIKTGTAIIIAQAGDKIATCTVTVKRRPVEANVIALDITTFTLAPGAARKLTVTVYPDDADDKTATWTSSDTSVATVNDDGIVTAVSEGSAIIIAQVGSVDASCTVYVNEEAVVNPDSPIVNPDSPVAVENVTLNAETLTIEPGATKKLQATVMPSNADDKAVTWSSSDTTVATVDSDGTITAHAEGTTTITAQASGRTATCAVTVRPILNPVENITLDRTTLTLMRGETEILKATVSPDNADDPSVTWWSSNPSVATVDNYGKVTAVDVGYANIHAQAGYMMAICSVDVETIYVESVTLDKDTLVLPCGEKCKLTATVTPEDADYERVTWDWSGWNHTKNSPIVKVDDDGTVTAYAEGTATISARAGTVRTGYKYAECTVTVTPGPVTDIKLEDMSSRIKIGEYKYFSAKVTPDNADDPTVTWSSSNPLVATVDNDGKVTAVAEGTTTITAQAGDVTATCEVTVVRVYIPITWISLTPKTLSLKRGAKSGLTMKSFPYNSDDTVILSSSNDDVATVDCYGWVTGGGCCGYGDHHRAGW